MRDLLLFAIVVGLVPIILWRPWIGILAWFWVGLNVPHANAWGFMRTFPIATLIGLAALIGVLIDKQRRPFPMTREMVTLLVFVAYTAMTSALGVYPSGAWEFWVHLMKILLITFVTPLLIYGERRILWLFFVIALSIGYYGLKGGIFAIMTGGNYMVLGPRGNSFISGNTYIGIALLMVWPLLLANARLMYRGWVDLGWPLLTKWSRLIGLGLYATFWLTGLAILATYSRGALLGILAVAPFIFLGMRRKWLLILLAFLAVGVIGVAAPERLMARWQTIETYEEDQSAMQRIQAWGANWNMALERPLTGMGFRNLHMGYDWYIEYANFEGAWQHVLSPHSIYFTLLGQHGFGGTAVYLLLVVFALLTLNRIRRTARQKTGQIWLAEYATAIQLSLLGFLVAGAFLDVAYFNLFYALIALTVVMRRELEEAPAPLPAQSPSPPSRRASHPQSRRSPPATRPATSSESGRRHPRVGERRKLPA